jgi:ADP-ribosylglycohydrolase
MRAAPIGLLAPNGAELLTAATAHARVTHADPRAVAGGVAVAAAVAAAARPGPISPPAFLAEIAALAGEVDAEMAAALSAMSAWIGRRPAAALRAALAHGGEVAGPPRAQGIPAHVIPSVLWSVFAFLRAPDDYWATVTTAIWPGGDTDTTAAMAGAISGARLGTEAPPEELARRIHDRGRWTAAELSALAHRCAKLASA